MSRTRDTVKPSSKDSVVGKRTKARQDKFIAAFGEAGTIRGACTLSKTDRSTVADWRQRDVQNFKVRLETANELFREGLQDLAFARVKLQKPDGNPVLIITLLNACWPEKYRRDTYRADDNAREMMIEWKKWVKSQDKVKKEVQVRKVVPTEKVESEESVIAQTTRAEDRKNALDAVEKILSRSKTPDPDSTKA